MAAKLKLGDVCALEVASGDPLFGRVLLDVDDQCIQPKRILTSSTLAFFRGAQYVEVTRDAACSQVVVPGMFVHAVELPRAGQRPVDPTKIDFPWTLTMYGPRPQFNWGELRIPVDLPIPEYRSILVPPRLSPVSSLAPTAQYRLDKKAEIDRSRFPDIEQYDPAKSDLRDSPNRARIEQLIAGRVLGDYFATALAYGYDLRRFYDPAHGKRTLVLCAYCRAELPGGAAACTVCAQPTGKDAPLEITVDQLALEDRKPCKACKAPILSTAVICRWCKTRQ